MFSNNKNQTMAKYQEQESPSINIIRKGTNIKGDIECSGDIRIDGNLTGTLQAQGKVVIGETGKVEGEIICANADVSGTLKASIKVKELLLLKSTSNLVGDIHTNKLAIEPGANFSGSCSMGSVKDIQSVNKSKEDLVETA